MDGEGAGKGDTPRPVNKKVYDENFDAIDWQHCHCAKYRRLCPGRGCTWIFVIPAE